MNLITIIQKIVGRFPGPGLLFEKLGTKVIAVNGPNGVRLKFVFPILKSFIVAIVRQHIDPHQHVTRFLSANPFIHFVIIDKMTVSDRIFAKFFNATYGVFVGLFLQLKQAGTVGCFFVLYPTNRVIIDYNFVFHNSGKLSDVKRNLQTATQFANAFVVHRPKRTVQKAVAQFDVINHFEKTGNTHKRINLFAIEQAGNLDFVIAVDFAGRVF